MKKILTILLVTLLLTGCGKSAKMEVENYLKKYKTLDSEVLVDLERVVESKDLNEKQKDKYRDVLKKQYKDLSYEIIKEEYDADISYITVKIEVYDLYKVESDASYYLENHRSEFEDNGTYNASKYMDYKLDKMQNTTDRINYDITFTVTKEDDDYVVMQPTENDLLKIHGIYNYELN